MVVFVRPTPSTAVVIFFQMCIRDRDYADERIVSFDELEPEERVFCSLLSNLVLGVPLVVISLIAGAM